VESARPQERDPRTALSRMASNGLRHIEGLAGSLVSLAREAARMVSYAAALRWARAALVESYFGGCRPFVENASIRATESQYVVGSKTWDRVGVVWAELRLCNVNPVSHPGNPS
jgi:hypothetical protein